MLIKEYCSKLCHFFDIAGSFSVIVVEFTKLILQLFASIFSLEDLCYVAERGETCLDVSKYLYRVSCSAM